jgi:hypothetical protein
MNAKRADEGLVQLGLSPFQARLLSVEVLREGTSHCLPIDKHCLRILGSTCVCGGCSLSPRSDHRHRLHDQYAVPIPDTSGFP